MVPMVIKLESVGITSMPRGYGLKKVLPNIPNPLQKAVFELISECLVFAWHFPDCSKIKAGPMAGSIFCFAKLMIWAGEEYSQNRFRLFKNISHI
jgi:hypothetical protein